MRTIASVVGFTVESIFLSGVVSRAGITGLHCSPARLALAAQAAAASAALACQRPSDAVVPRVIQLEDPTALVKC